MDGETQLRALLTKLDATDPPVSVTDIVAPFRVLQKDLEEQGIPIPESLRYELIAYTLIGRIGQEDESRWGTYYGPMAVFSDNEGKEYDAPDLESITEGALEYWQNRHRATSNIVARMRYADLIWDFSKTVAGSNPDVEYAQSVIDSTIDLLKKGWYESVRHAWLAIERALSVALSINDKARVAKVRDELIRYENSVCNDESPGSWGRSFDLLVLNKSVDLPDVQEDRIILDLEGRLARVVSPDEGTPISPLAVDHATFRLANYYSRKDRWDDVKRVMRLYRDAHLELANSPAVSASISAAWLQRVADALRAKGMRDDAKVVLSRLEHVQGRIGEELTSHSHEVSISKEELDHWLDDITAGRIDEVFSRVAHYFVPRREQIEEQIKDLAEKAPLQALIQNVITDENGRALGTVGSV